MTYKAHIRSEVTSLLTTMSTRRMIMLMQTIQKNLFASKIWRDADMIGVTVSSDIEWDTHSIITQAWTDQKKVAVPKAYHKTKKLTFHNITAKKNEQSSSLEKV